MRLAEQGQ